MSFWFWAIGVPLACLLLFFEWRRPNRRRLWHRFLAILLALAALVLMAVPPDRRESNGGFMEASLWTAGSDATTAAGTGDSPLFTLPEAVDAAPRKAVVMPDVVTLRRRYPQLATLHIFGSGLDPADLPSLSGLKLILHPPVPQVASVPAIRFLHCPRELVLGDALVVTGRVEGLSSGTRLPLVLEAPDGHKTEAVTAAANAQGEAEFTLRSPPLSATGRFVWQLRCAQITEDLGILVVSPRLPRVLVLEGTPHFDTPALRRWLGDAGGLLTIRTRVGKENVRFASTQKGVAPFTAVDSALLSGYDLLLADGVALTELHGEERTALEAAVEQNGLGLLVLADDAVLRPASGQISSDLRSLLPWQFMSTDDNLLNEDRTVRPHWSGQIAPSEIPVPAAPFGVQRAADQSLLVDDPQQHVLAAVSRRGQGLLAVTLIHDTSRWQRENDPAAFAAYWSFLFTRISRSSDDPAGRWTLADGDNGPVYVDHPLQLCWTGPPGKEPGATAVADGSNTANVSLPLIQDSRESGSWQGTFWPRRAGWHRVATQPGGATFDFYVHPAGTWPAIQSARRRSATALFAEQTAPLSSTVALDAKRAVHSRRGWWFTLFFLATGYLWIERRYAGTRATIT